MDSRPPNHDQGHNDDQNDNHDHDHETQSGGIPGSSSHPPSTAEDRTLEDIVEIWNTLSHDERITFFKNLPREIAGELFLNMRPSDQVVIVENVPEQEQKIWMRALAPDDAADVIQELSEEMRPKILALLDSKSRAEVVALLSYEEDEAGGLMSPRFARTRDNAPVAEAISYLRHQARANLETIYYVYVFDALQRLVGVLSFREIFTAPDNALVRDVMETDLITVDENMDQESVAQLMTDHNLVAVPVVDAEMRMKGIVTLDDIMDVVEEEATEDIQKIGGSVALDTSYISSDFLSLIRKRAGWLAILFVGEMLTATAMAHFEKEIAKAVVLALFIPLIISSGGNSGSQASTLIIRALALREIGLRDWWQVFKREMASGLMLGSILATIGMVRILIGGYYFHAYGEHYWPITITVALSVVSVVTWGTIMGSMLPFILRYCKLDPASASAPFVATLVDVVGLVIYFNMAHMILSGTLL